MLLPYLCWGWIAAEPNECKGKVEEPAFFAGTSLMVHVRDCGARDATSRDHSGVNLKSWMITSTSWPFFGANPLNSHRLMCTGIGCCETCSRGLAGTVNPGADLLAVIIAVALQRSEFHPVAAPDEPVRRLVIGQGEREGPGNLLQRLHDRPHRVVAHRVLRITPPCEFDVDLVCPIRSNISRGVVEESQHHVVVKTVKPAGGLKLVPAKTQTPPHRDFGTGPFPIPLADLQMQVGRRIQPRVVLVPRIGSRSTSARPDGPGVASEFNVLGLRGETQRQEQSRQ